MALASLLFAAWLIYQPAAPRSFDYVDFPENIKVLIDNPGLGSGFRSLMDVYVNHGRWAPITIGTLAAQWSLFEWWTAGWQLTRFGIMGACVVFAYWFARRLGLTSIGAIASASLLIVSPAAVMGWTRLSTAEPITLLFLLVACHAAIGRRTISNSLALGVLLLAVMWTKEIATAAFALPVLIAFAIDENGRLNKPSWKSGHTSLLAAIGAAFAIGAAPILWTLFTAPRDSFARAYAGSGFSLGDIFGGSLTAWLPFVPVSERSASVVLVVVAAYLVILITGWRKALQSQETRTHRRFILTLAIGIPVIGGLSYAPWPFYLLVYALPFIAAGSLLLGQSVGVPSGGGVADRVIPLAGVTIVLTFGAAQAFNESERTRALHEVFAQTVARVAVVPDIDSALVDVAPGQFDPQGNFGPRFIRYARMLNLPWPAVRDVSCDEFEVRQPRTLRLRLNLMCDPPERTTPLISARYAQFSWPNPRPRIDSVTMSFGEPARR